MKAMGIFTSFSLFKKLFSIKLPQKWVYLRLRYQKKSTRQFVYTDPFFMNRGYRNGEIRMGLFLGVGLEDVMGPGREKSDVKQS